VARLPVLRADGLHKTVGTGRARRKVLDPPDRRARRGDRRAGALGQRQIDAAASARLPRRSGRWFDRAGGRPGSRLFTRGLGTEHVVGLVEAPDNVGYPLAKPRFYLSAAQVNRRFGADPRPRVNLAEVWLRDPRYLNEVLVQARDTSFGLRNIRFVFGPELTRLAINYATLDLTPAPWEVGAVVGGLVLFGALAAIWVARQAVREPVIAGLSR
jgi:hypothetical protein